MQDKEYYKKYYNNPENKKKRMENNRNWRLKYPERFRELARISGKRVRMRKKKEIFELLGNKCANPYNLPHPDWCNDSRVLQIDHIHGGGNQEKRRNKGDRGSHHYYDILRKIKNGSKDYQLLCANCNWIKRFENNETGWGRRIEYE